MIIKRTLAGIVLAGALAFSGCERKIEEDQLRQEQVQNKSQKEVVVHNSGSSYSWKALDNGDYLPRTNEIFNILKTDTSNNISGGFNPNPNIFFKLGTYVNQVQEDKIDMLIEKYENHITKNKKLLTALQGCLKDSSSYIISN